jgi:hypothetical protein
MGDDAHGLGGQPALGTEDQRVVVEERLGDRDRGGQEPSGVVPDVENEAGERADPLGRLGPAAPAACRRLVDDADSHETEAGRELV